MGIQALGCCKDRVRDSSTGAKAKTPEDQIMDLDRRAKDANQIRQKHKKVLVNNSFEFEQDKKKANLDSKSSVIRRNKNQQQVIKNYYGQTGSTANVFNTSQPSSVANSISDVYQLTAQDTKPTLVQKPSEKIRSSSHNLGGKKNVKVVTRKKKRDRSANAVVEYVEKAENIQQENDNLYYAVFKPTPQAETNQPQQITEVSDNQGANDDAENAVQISILEDAQKDQNPNMINNQSFKAQDVASNGPKKQYQEVVIIDVQESQPREHEIQKQQNNDIFTQIFENQSQQEEEKQIERPGSL